MGSSVDNHSLERTVVFVPSFLAAVMDSGKGIENPFVKMAGYCTKILEKLDQVDSFAYRAGRLAGNMGFVGFVDFVVGIMSNQSFEVDFDISMVGY